MKKILLVGQPNSGKTTIYNGLVGANQKTGNYPGVTVEEKVGYYQTNEEKYEIIDLPGIYSLSTHSPEEVIARDALIKSNADLVVNVIDSSNLERNLYLTVQLLELKIPVLLVFNMWDDIERKGIKIDLEKMKKALGTEIVTTIAHKKNGINELRDSIETNLNRTHENSLHYSFETEKIIKKTQHLISEDNLVENHPPKRWLAIKLLEKDEKIIEYFKEAKQIQNKTEKFIEDFNFTHGEDTEIYFADQRYGFISGMCQKYVKNPTEWRHTISDKIDMVFTNKFLGIPLFLFMMYMLFKLTFTLGEPMMGLIETGFEALSGLVESFWPAGSESLLKSLVVDGIIGGVGGVMVFLPNIILLFSGIAILEGTGYMARVAFIMDRLMKSIGLDGKSFIPMLIGFGCTVPAIMATRTLENKKDRFTTILIAPLMSCGARLPIYMLLIPAFFPKAWQTPILWGIYLLGIFVAIILAKVLRSTIFKGKKTSFIMELPPYRIPTFQAIVLKMWSRAWLYLKKAGTIILGISILMWALATFPQNDKISEKYETKITEINNSTLLEEEKEEKIIKLQNALISEELAYTITGRIGKFMEPVLKPLGFDWKIGTSFIGAFAAKEVFVSQMGIVFSVGEADEESQSLRDQLRKNYSGLQALAIMIFALISVPCVATVAVTKRETNSWKWPLVQVFGLTAVAYIITLIFYQIGSLFV